MTTTHTLKTGRNVHPDLEGIEYIIPLKPRDTRRLRELFKSNPDASYSVGYRCLHIRFKVQAQVYDKRMYR